jgi:hypothetical protein
VRGVRSNVPVEGIPASGPALELLGRKKAKPEGVRCPVCSEQVGGWAVQSCHGESTAGVTVCLCLHAQLHPSGVLNHDCKQCLR